MIKAFVLLVCTVLALCLVPDLANCQINCSSKTIEASESELDKYIVHPWYANEDNINDALVSILTGTDYDETLLEVKSAAANDIATEKTKPTKNYSGSVETEIILGMSDFIIDRAKAETVSWYMDEMQKNLCDGDYHEYFYNTCIMRSQSKDAMPYLPGLVQAFRKDLEFIPASLLCKNFQTDRGYYLTSLMKNVIAGIPAENLIAGLAQNDGIDKGCSADTISKQENTCDFFIAGVLAQTYLNLKKPKDLNIAIEALYAKLEEKKLQPEILSEIKKKQKFLEIAAIFKDIKLQVKKIKRAKKEGNQQAILSSSTIQIGEDVAAIIYNPFAMSIKGANYNARNFVKPALKAISSINAGQYSDAMLDANILISLYYDDKIKEINVEIKNKIDALKDDIIIAIAENESLLFMDGEFADVKAMKSACNSIYALYAKDFPAEQKQCQSLADLNDLLSKENLPERLLEKAYSSKVEGLLIIQNYLGKKKPDANTAVLGKKIQIILNRLIMEETLLILPKSKFCSAYADVLRDYSVLYNPDIEQKRAQKWAASKYLSVDDRVAQIEETLKLPKPGMFNSPYDSKQCKDNYSKLSQILTAAYSDKGIDMISSDNPVQKYLPIVASLATAKNQDEIKNVLNETASTVGSWRLKQKKDYTGSFGAMLGLDFGYEYLRNSPNDGWATGLFAPVGFDFTTKKLLPNNTACGIFVSLLDLGTVASMRLSDGSAVASKGGNLHISEVASPGAYVHVSVKNTPVVVGLGWSYVPLLRTEDVNGEKTDRSGSRVLLFIAVDLPMYFF